LLFLRHDDCSGSDHRGRTAPLPGESPPGPAAPLTQSAALASGIEDAVLGRIIDVISDVISLETGDDRALGSRLRVGTLE